MRQLYARYSERAHFAAIYIAEAHARDEWPVGKTVSFVDQPTQIEQRLEVAALLRTATSFPLPLLIDSIDNSFQSAYAAWPFRFYIIYRGKIVVKAQPDPVTHGYHLTDIEDYLEENHAVHAAAIAVALPAK